MTLRLSNLMKGFAHRDMNPFWRSAGVQPASAQHVELVGTGSTPSQILRTSKEFSNPELQIWDGVEPIPTSFMVRRNGTLANRFFNFFETRSHGISRAIAAWKIESYSHKIFLLVRTTSEIKNIFSRNSLILLVNKLLVTFSRIFCLRTTSSGSKMDMFPQLMGIMHERKLFSFLEDLSVSCSFYGTAFLKTGVGNRI